MPRIHLNMLSREATQVAAYDGQPTESINVK